MAKIGEGAGKAWLELGRSEFLAVIYPSSNIAGPTEPGIWGVANESRRDDVQQPDEERSILREKMQQVADTVQGLKREPERGIER